jgi:flagellar biosynthesis regulator FlaF
MNQEPFIQQAQRSIDDSGATMDEAARLDDLAVRLMAVQRHWDHPERDLLLNTVLQSGREVWHGIQGALAEGALALPLEVRQNLLILSVYAHSKIESCEAKPDSHVLGSLIALTRSLAGSLKEWRVAA